jgi:hypothetical protein
MMAFACNSSACFVTLLAAFLHGSVPPHWKQQAYRSRCQAEWQLHAWQKCTAWLLDFLQQHHVMRYASSQL